MGEVKFQGHAVTPTSFRFIPLSFHVNHIGSWKSFIGSNIESIHDDVIKWKHFPRYWPFVREIHRSPVNFPHKGQWRGALMFTLICARMNGWVNNREAGDLRRYRVHYDVIVMSNPFFFMSIGPSIPEIWLWHPEEARTWCTKSWSDNIRQNILNLIRCVDMQWIRLILGKYCGKRTRFCPQTHGQTDGRTDGPTRWNQYTPLQLRWSEWHIKHNQSLSIRTPSFIKQSHRVLYLVAHSPAMLEPEWQETSGSCRTEASNSSLFPASYLFHDAFLFPAIFTITHDQKLDSRTEVVSKTTGSGDRFAVALAVNCCFHCIFIHIHQF